MAGPRRKRHEEEEEHENHERWLVTYADMLTLLMVLFIVMFAMSQVDQKKYAALRSGLADGFGQDSSYMEGSDSILSADGSSITSELASDARFQKMPKTQQAVVKAATEAELQSRRERAFAEAQAEANRLERVRKRIEAALERHGLSQDVKTSIDERGLVVSLVSRHVVFRADVADLSARGRRVVDVLAPVLRDLPDPLRVDGHTNQVAVQPAFYDTDWDLSAARAVTVLRRLHETGRVPEKRLSMSAFGHERPLVDPKKAGSQEVNKRVDIVVLSSLPAESRELLEQAARPRTTSEATTTPRRPAHTDPTHPEGGAR
jgi:chemotaxis protein MotB